MYFCGHVSRTSLASTNARDPGWSEGGGGLGEVRRVSKRRIDPRRAVVGQRCQGGSLEGNATGADGRATFVLDHRYAGVAERDEAEHA